MPELLHENWRMQLTFIKINLFNALLFLNSWTLEERHSQHEAKFLFHYYVSEEEPNTDNYVNGVRCTKVSPLFFLWCTCKIKI